MQGGSFSQNGRFAQGGKLILLGDESTESQMELLGRVLSLNPNRNDWEGAIELSFRL